MKQIKFTEPYLVGDEQKHINNVFKNNNYFGIGYYTKKCEKLLTNQLKSPNVLLTDSCTSSLEIAALLIKNSNKNEIIVPSYTFTSTASAFLKNNFKIVFAEIDKKTLMLDYEDVRKKINIKTRAIVVVHYGGMACEIIKFRKICKEKNILLIEDCAQGFGCKINKSALGTIGDIGCFSFHQTKNIHSGLGGAIYLKDDNYFRRAISIRDRGTNRQEFLDGQVKFYQWVEIGGSFYPTELQAAFLYSQLLKTNKNIKIRKKLYSHYHKLLKNLNKNDKLKFQKQSDNLISNFHAFIIILKSFKERKNIIDLLKKNKIEAVIGYMPLHSSKIGKALNYKTNDLQVTENISKKILRLPMHANLKKNQIVKICKLIEDFFDN